MGGGGRRGRKRKGCEEGAGAAEVAGGIVRDDGGDSDQILPPKVWRQRSGSTPS